MMKRIAAVAAVSLAAMQVLAGFTGVAMATHNGPGKHLGKQSNTQINNATASCTVTAGIAVIQDGAGVATIWTDGTYLYCDVNGSLATLASSEFGSVAPELADITSAIVYANDGVTVWLEQADDAGPPGNDRPANFGGLKLTVDSGGTLHFDGSGLENYYGGTIVLTDTSFSGQGLVGTIYAATDGQYTGGKGPDSFDASAVTADITAAGNDGNDVLKSGSGDDTLTAGAGSDKLYAGAGYDSASCAEDDSKTDQCWAGAGDDSVTVGSGYPVPNSGGVVIYDIAAPGDGFDQVFSSFDYALNYSDSSVAVEFDGTGVYSDTGDDTLNSALFKSFTGSPKGDLLYDFNRINGGAGADVIIGSITDPTVADVLSGGGGKDKIRSLGGADTIYGDSGADTIKGGAGDDSVYGGGGDDVLYGLSGVDFLKGGTGMDQTWGGSGIDTCSGEVRDSCEFRKG